MLLRRAPMMLRSVRMMSSSSAPVLTEVRGKVGLITLNRPKALNALCDALFDDLIDAASTFDGEDDIGCMVITGSSKAFAAGADISEMSQREFSYAYKNVSAWLSIVVLSTSVGIVGLRCLL